MYIFITVKGIKNDFLKKTKNQSTFFILNFTEQHFNSGDHKLIPASLFCKSPHCLSEAAP